MVLKRIQIVESLYFKFEKIERDRFSKQKMLTDPLDKKDLFR